MDKHWNHYCTMSIVHFMAFPTTITGDGPIAATVSKIAEDSFFGAVEITHINDPAERQKTRDVIEASHIKVGFGGQPLVLRGKLNPNSLEDAERKAAVTALKALIQSTKELCAYGRDKGIGITCETFDRAIDKKALVGPSDFAAEYAASVRQDYPDFGLMYDLSHQPLLYEESEKALRLLKPHLVHIHVGNGVRDEGKPGYGDLHPRFGWPGGCNDVDELAVFIRALFKVDYLKEGMKEKPWVGFEIKPQSERETPEQVIAGTKRAWQEAWALA